MAYIDQISNNFYQLTKKLAEAKIFFLVSASLAEHEVEGRSCSNRGKQRWQVARLEIKGIHRYKNRVNEKQATASWFNDTVEIWSGLIKVELFATILQSIYWIENWIVRTNVIRCSIYFFSLINLSQRFNKNDVIRSCFSNIQFFIYVCIHFSPFQSACFLCIEKKNRYPTRFSLIFYWKY